MDYKDTLNLPRTDFAMKADLVAREVVAHEREDEARVYPQLRRYLHDGHGLTAMSRAHREIQHLARLLGRLAQGLQSLSGKFWQFVQE